jgi:hypothetical protein
VTRVKADGKLQALAEWRASHFPELESTLAVLKGIRDDPDASNKDRIEASKSIGRLLAVMSPEKIDLRAKPRKDKENKPSDKEWAEINGRLAA